MRGAGKPLIIYALYDFDRSGRDASASLREKVERFRAEFGVPVEFNVLGLTLDQVRALGLPTREPKRGTTADRKWPHTIAAELDAIPADTLRGMVRNAKSATLAPIGWNGSKRLRRWNAKPCCNSLGDCAHARCTNLNCRAGR